MKINDKEHERTFGRGKGKDRNNPGQGRRQEQLIKSVQSSRVKKKKSKETLIAPEPFKITESGNNIRVRIDDPDVFDVIRTKDPGRIGFTKILVGRKKGQKTTRAQAVLFDKTDFGRTEAIRKAKKLRRELLVTPKKQTTLSPATSKQAQFKVEKQSILR